MSLWNDFWDFVGDTVSSVGHVIEDAAHAILKNPIGAITSVVAMSYGIPPAWAGALGGAAGAAATGGNVVKGALTGGAMGYMGSVAGAATGAAGPIAQAAATGAASAVTGAVLTGQDVMTAVKSGLILGAVSGGVAQLMTPQEAVSSVPKDIINQANTTKDPIGYITEKMGWAASDSATQAANTVVGQNLKSSITGLADSIPESVLKEAAALPPGSDTNTFISNKMGWENNGITVNAASTAMGDYLAGSTSASVPAATSATQIANTGLVDAGDAAVLAHNGYTATDVQNLVNQGYAASDLVDMASTGVSANTLSSLAKTQFSEATINNLLTKGVAAGEIASASNLVNAGKISIDAANTLMDKGVSGSGLNRYAYSGKADQIANLMNKGLSANTVDSLYASGLDLNKISAGIDNGQFDANTVNTKVGQGNYTKWVNDTLNPPATTTQPSQPSQPTTPVATAPVAPVQPGVEDLWSSYSQNDAYNPATSTQADVANLSKNYAIQDIKSLYGTSTNNSLLTNLENPNTFYAKNLAAAELTNNPEAYLKSVGYNQATVDQMMDYYDAKQYAMKQYATEQTQYADAQKALQSQQVVSDAGGGGTTPFTVESTGVPKFAGMQGAGTPPSGFDVATPEQIWGPNDTGTASKPYTPGAYYDAESNTWYAPKIQAPVTPETPTVPITPPVETPVTPPVETTPSVPIAPPVVPPTTTPPQTPTVGAGDTIAGPTVPTTPVTPPVVTPPTTTPPVTQIPEVTVTAPKEPTPVVPIVTPNVTPPTQGPVTVVSSTTRTQSDGSVIRDDKNSDGSTTSTLISGPTTSTGPVVPPTTTPPTSTGPVTEIPEITVTAPKEPPLTPPTTVVVPPTPKIPEVVVPDNTTPPPDTTTPPPDTTTPVPIVPIDVPVEPKTPATLHGVSNIGPTPYTYIPHGLNPGWITNVPTHYQTTNPSQAQYYWGGHPYQPGPKFDPTLYNQTINAPVEPFGSTYAQTSATPQQILQAMQGRYPLLNTVSVTGPVAP